MSKQKCADLVLVIIFSVALFSCKKKGEETPAPFVPVVKIEDASQARATTGSVIHFSLTLNQTTTVPVSVDYLLTDVLQRLRGIIQLLPEPSLFLLIRHWHNSRYRSKEIQPI